MLGSSSAAPVAVRPVTGQDAHPAVLARVILGLMLCVGAMLLLSLMVSAMGVMHLRTGLAVQGLGFILLALAAAWTCSVARWPRRIGAWLRRAFQL
jgi:hypothetical protein